LYFHHNSKDKKGRIMAGVVPLISSGVAGPLGVLHLPRFWSKVLLDAKGLLADGYPACGKGYDQMVLDGLGLEREKTLAYLRTNLPSYPQFEKWIMAQKGGKLDKAAVDKLNAAIKGYNHDDETRTEILSAAGIQDDKTILDAVNLNNLDDWTACHAALTK
jgi:hypothetical protein